MKTAAKTNLMILLVVLSIGICMADTKIRQGAFIAAADGELIVGDANDVRFFQFAEDVNEPGLKIPAGYEIPILPGSVLEKLNYDADHRAQPMYKIWGQVEIFETQSYLFPINFAAVSGPTIEKPTEDEKPNSTEGADTVNDPNDAFLIPQEVLQRMQRRRIVQPKQLVEQLKLKQDFMITERVGFIEKTENGYSFRPDGLGWNVSDISFHIHPNAVLERVLRIQSKTPEKIRFSISGVVTQFEDRTYLLMQNASRVYRYGNFE